MKNKFRQALLDKQVSFGAWVQISHPAAAEIYGRLGYDWICVDLEHGAVGFEGMTNIFRAIDSFGSVPVARLPFCDTIWIKRTLDAGARGLIVPMVNTPAEAEHAIREAKYPPRGQRGYGFSRGNVHGIDFFDAVENDNDEIAMVMQIEHKDGVANLDSILSVDGVDGAFIGPYDLSGSYGKTGALDSPEMLDALSRFRAGCKAHDKAAGMHVVNPTEPNVAAAIADGYSMIALGVDVVSLVQSARTAIDIARKGAQQ